MYACLHCGKRLPPRKERGHREREYCNDLCRQRASRARNKGKHDLRRLQREAEERRWNAIEQDIHREDWQDRLELNTKLITGLLEETQQMREYIACLEKDLADKEAEIIRLNILLDSQSKKKQFRV